MWPNAARRVQDWEVLDEAILRNHENIEFSISEAKAKSQTDKSKKRKVKGLELNYKKLAEDRVLRRS